MKAKKILIAIAAAAAIASPSAVLAGDGASVSGFADIIYANDDFGADAEIDVVDTVGSVTVGVDIDLNLALNGGASSAATEQVFFAWGATDAVTIIGGVFNNPIGADAEDAPNMDFTSHSVVYKILDHQTALRGNNIAGVAAAGAVGPVTLTVATLNDIGGSATENSFAIVANASPMDGLDLEFGYVTQQDLASSTNAAIAQAGNVWNVNATLALGQFTVVTDILGAADIIDLAYNVTAKFAVNDALSVHGRYESVAWDTAVAGGTSTKTTIYAGYSLADNLAVALESSSSTSNNALDGAVTGISGTSETTVEFIATF
ncbi:hypothetical protein JYT55_00600 [Mariprofundus ferrooxydans]|nr:hypothetical protein [Mariprofundus ferrooxydans]